jgi:hypothetical protein
LNPRRSGRPFSSNPFSSYQRSCKTDPVTVVEI